MPLIKRYDTLACELLSEEEIVNTEPEKENRNEIKEDEKNKVETMKANEIAEVIIFS